MTTHSLDVLQAAANWVRTAHKALLDAANEAMALGIHFEGSWDAKLERPMLTSAINIVADRFRIVMVTATMREL